MPRSRVWNAYDGKVTESDRIAAKSTQRLL